LYLDTNFSPLVYFLLFVSLETRRRRRRERKRDEDEDEAMMNMNNTRIEGF